MKIEIDLQPDTLSEREKEAIRRAVSHLKEEAARRQTEHRIDPEKLYNADEVMILLGCSYDTALRRMKKMNHVNMGTKERVHKRKRGLVRVKGKVLIAYLKSHTET